MNDSPPQQHPVSGVNTPPTDVSTQPQPALLHLAPVAGKAVALDCEGGRVSADAGVGLRKDSDAPRGFTRDLAAVLSDPRDPRRRTFPLHDLLKQRVFQSAAGDEEANDSNSLRDDPRFTLRRDRLPATGAPVASQPTLSRLANRAARTERDRMAVVVLEPFMAADATPPTGIGREGEDTEAPVPGQQEQARYDGDYGGDGLLPLHVDAGRSGRLSTTLLQATRCPGTPRLAVVQRLVKRLRYAWPKTLLSVRGDSHFASPEVLQWSEEHPHLSSVPGLTSTAVLHQLAPHVVAPAQRASAQSGRIGFSNAILSRRFRQQPSGSRRLEQQEWQQHGTRGWGRRCEDRPPLRWKETSP